MNYSVNPDSEEVYEILTKIAKNSGYCPCAIEKNADTRCMCKNFREKIPVGEYCHCGLYMKLAEDD